MLVVMLKTLKHQVGTPVTTCGRWSQSTNLGTYRVYLGRGDGTLSFEGLNKTKMNCVRTSTSESHGFNGESVKALLTKFGENSPTSKRRRGKAQRRWKMNRLLANPLDIPVTDITNEGS